jgi:hypothetical protein
VDLQALEEAFPEHISKRARLHGRGMDAEAVDGMPMNMVTVMFSRCKDIEQMISGEVSWDDSATGISGTKRCYSNFTFDTYYR